MKKGFGLLILFFVCNILQGQSYDEIISDLHQQLDAHSIEDEKRVDLLNDLSYAYRRSKPEKIDSFAKEALYLAEKLDYPRGMGIAYKNLGIATYKMGGKTDDVMALYQKCYDLAKQGNDYYSQAACSNNIGLSHKSALQYTKAIKAFQNAQEIHTAHLPVDRLRMLIIGNIGKTYVSMEDYKNAHLYLEEAISLAEKHDNQAVIVMYMENYALVQHKQGKVDEAIETLIKYMPMTKSIGDYQTFIQATTTLSDIFIEEQKFDEADIYIEQGMEVAEQYNLSVYKCEITINHSKVLLAKKRFAEAQKFGEEAYYSAKNRLEYQQQMRAAKNLLSIYLANQDARKAKELFPIYQDLMERHFDTERQKTYASLEAQYQNKILKSQQSENESTIKVQRVLGLSILLLSLSVIGGILYAYRTKRTQNNLLEKKVEERTKALNESYQKLERSNQDLERSNEELERFAYIASHDLKQPLNTVISFSALLDKQLNGTLDTKSNTYLKYVIKGGNQMKQLVEDILEYSKLNQEKRESQVIDLNVLVNEVTDSISELTERKNAQVNIIGTLPSLQHEKTKIFLLFKNLIENGIKYNQSEKPVISIQQSEYEDFTRFSFTDNGIGIEEKYFPKLFKMFSRLQNSKDYEGTGLGLSLCKKIVSNMGGNISLESQPGKGSTFHVDIPGDLFVESMSKTYTDNEVIVKSYKF